MNKLFALFSFALIFFLLASCSQYSVQTPTPAAELTEEITFAPILPTSTPLPTTAPTPHPTPTAYQPIQGTILFDDMRLRRGPGFLFETIGLYPINQSVSLLGRAPGNNWFYVRTNDDLTGWMKMEGIDLQGNFYDAPEVTPGDVIVVHGRVFGTNGSPASDLGLMIQPAALDDPVKQEVAKTDVTGRFYFYLTPGTQGDWIVALNAYGCEGSAVDRNCSLIGKFPEPVTITLPDAAETELEFHLLPLQ